MALMSLGIGCSSNSEVTPGPVEQHVGSMETTANPSAEGWLLLAEHDTGGTGSLTFDRYEPTADTRATLWTTDSQVNLFGVRWGVSPDGQQIAYWSSVRDRSAQGGRRLDLIARRLTSQGERRVVGTNPNPLCGRPFWSTDSASVWYLAPTVDDSRAGIGGGELHKIVVGDFVDPPQAGDDRLMMTFPATDFGLIQLAAINGSAQRLVLIAMEPENDSGRRHRAKELLLVDMTDWQILVRLEIDTLPNWVTASTGGRHVAVTEYGTGNASPRTRILDVAQSTVREIQPETGEIPAGPPRWSWDGGWVSWATRKGWRVIRLDSEPHESYALPKPKPKTVTRLQSSNRGEAVGHELVAVAPGRPTLLLRAGIVGLASPRGAQAQRYFLHDLKQDTVQVLEQLPADRPLLIAWLPTD